METYDTEKRREEEEVREVPDEGIDPTRQQWQLWHFEELFFLVGERGSASIMTALNSVHGTFRLVSVRHVHPNWPQPPTSPSQFLVFEQKVRKWRSFWQTTG